MESRLDRMVARLATQRACLNHAADLMGAVPGPILELGLGKGRTWSHLVQLFPNRDIFAFDHSLHAPPDLTPPANLLLLGDLRETLEKSKSRFGGSVALIHADIGTADGQGELGDTDLELACFVGDCAAALLAPGGLLVGDREMRPAGDLAFERLPLPVAGLPADLPPWPYFIFRFGNA